MSQSSHPIISYVGAHYSLCPVELRELWTKVFDSPEGRKRLAQILRESLGESPGQTSFVPVFTCNRFDIFLEGQPSPENLVRVFVALSKFALDELSGDFGPSRPSGLEKGLDYAKGVLSNPEKLVSHLRVLLGDDATVQLFRVASSLDSLVLGEPHILGQLKEQFIQAKELGLASPALEAAFLHAFATARRVRSETDLGKNAVSVGHAAVAVAQRIFDDLSKTRALVIGAGEMGRLASQHLLSKGVPEIWLANRGAAGRDRLSQELGRANPLDMPAALRELCAFDLVIVATGSREPIILPHHLSGFDKKRRGKPMVLVDISVPRNVDPRCIKASSSLYLFDVDDLDKVMEHNRSLREDAAREAEGLIVQEVHRLRDVHVQREELKFVGQFHQFVRSAVRDEIEKSIRKRGTLSGPDEPDVLADAIAKKLVSTPARLARESVMIPESDIGQALLALFDLAQSKSS